MKRTLISLLIVTVAFAGCERSCYRTGADVTAIDSIINGVSRYTETRKTPIVWDCEQVIEGVSQLRTDTLYSSTDTTVLKYEFIRFKPQP